MRGQLDFGRRIRIRGLPAVKRRHNGPDTELGVFHKGIAFDPSRPLTMWEPGGGANRLPMD